MGNAWVDLTQTNTYKAPCLAYIQGMLDMYSQLKLDTTELKQELMHLVHPNDAFDPLGSLDSQLNHCTESTLHELKKMARLFI